MHSSHLLEEPIRMASILESSKTNFFPTMTKIVGTLGPKSRSVEVISGCFKDGMSGYVCFCLERELGATSLHRGGGGGDLSSATVAPPPFHCVVCFFPTTMRCSQFKSVRYWQ